MQWFKRFRQSVKAWNDRRRGVKPFFLAERYPQYTIGPGSYGDITLHTWNDDTQLTIGAYTSIAAGVNIVLGGEHRKDWVTTYPFNELNPAAADITGHPHTKGHIHIGSDVWVATQALILSGVTIGNGAVVGARAVVTRDVPPYAIVSGAPAKVVAYRFSEEQIQRLLSIAWWGWPKPQVEKAIPDLMQGDIDLFIERAERGYYQS